MTSVDRGPFWHAQSWSRHWITPSSDITSVQIGPAGARKQLKEGGLAWRCSAKELLEIVGQRAWELFLDLGLRVWFSNLFFKSWLSPWWCLFDFTLISQLPAPTLSPRSPSLGSGDELLPNLSIRGVTRCWRTRSWWHWCGDRDSSWVVDTTDQKRETGARVILRQTTLELCSGLSERPQAQWNHAGGVKQRVHLEPASRSREVTPEREVTAGQWIKPSRPGRPQSRKHDESGSI